MWCHYYLVCAARGLHNLNKQTDKNIISTLHSQHVAAPLFTCDARHPTPTFAASSSSTQSPRRCEREPCKLCRAVEESPSLATGIRMSFIVIVKQVEIGALSACCVQQDANNPSAHITHANKYSLTE